MIIFRKRGYQLLGEADNLIPHHFGDLQVAGLFNFKSEYTRECILFYCLKNYQLLLWETKIISLLSLELAMSDTVLTSLRCLHLFCTVKVAYENNFILYFRKRLYSLLWIYAFSFRL